MKKKWIALILLAFTLLRTAAGYGIVYSENRPVSVYSARTVLLIFAYSIFAVPYFNWVYLFITPIAGVFCAYINLRMILNLQELVQYKSDMRILEMKNEYLLENAPESCEKIPEDKDRRIQVKLKTRLSYLCLSISNARCGELIIKDGFYASTKGASSLHGHGISVVKKIVDKKHRYNRRILFLCFSACSYLTTDYS